MNALDRVRSLELTKQTGLSIVLGGLLALSPLYANFGGSVLASLAAFLLGALAMAVAVAEAAGSPRVKNHGWPLAIIAAVVLIIPWILALTGVGQVLGTFSVAAVALVAAATWRVTAASEDSLGAAPDAEPAADPPVAEPDAQSTPVAIEDKEAATEDRATVQSVDQQPKAKPVQSSANESGDEKGRRSSKADGSAGNGKEAQQVDADDGHAGKADHKPSADVEPIKPDVAAQKKSARQKVSEPVDAA